MSEFQCLAQRGKNMKLKIAICDDKVVEYIKKYWFIKEKISDRH